MSASMASAAPSQGSSQASVSLEETSPQAVSYPPPFTPQTLVLGPVQPVGLAALTVNGVVVAPAPSAAPRDPGQAGEAWTLDERAPPCGQEQLGPSGAGPSS